MTYGVVHRAISSSSQCTLAQVGDASFRRQPFIEFLDNPLATSYQVTGKELPGTKDGGLYFIHLLFIHV